MGHSQSFLIIRPYATFVHPMDEPMNRRKFIIGAIAGGVGLAEYIYTSEYMNQLADPSRDLSVKEYGGYGGEAALAAITTNDQFYIESKGDTQRDEGSCWRIKIDGDKGD